MLAKQFQQALNECPIVAIIRGVEPKEVEAVANALLDAGVRIIEVPLNSPSPLASIEKLAKIVEGRGICGAGTVTTASAVTDVHNAGGQLIVSPNADASVIEATLQAKMISLPGCITPSDCYVAINAGASYLKMFPIGDLGPTYYRSVMAIIPKHITTLTVGGMHEGNLADYWQLGSRGFGVASNIYAPGDSAATVTTKARILVDATKQLPRS
ncbi:2-dehydro-3-deoxy-6-phosphogalactonate aldolase [Simiduia litorea]|uniref:2-dehydro-3-deoxy-6-phosphogalactonate aldolase n=1 Tax=Simiduia litorea TaxID=1435348 RepID=UPI0036F2F359